MTAARMRADEDAHPLEDGRESLDAGRAPAARSKRRRPWRRDAPATAARAVEGGSTTVHPALICPRAAAPAARPSAAPNSVSRAVGAGATT